MAKIRQIGGVTDASIQALETRRVVDEAEVPAQPVLEETAAAADELVDDGDPENGQETAAADLEPVDEGQGAEAGPVDYSKMRKPELVAELERRGADTAGNVVELRERLAALDEQSDSDQQQAA